jgi:hypothetical protein
MAFLSFFVRWPYFYSVFFLVFGLKSEYFSVSFFFLHFSVFIFFLNLNFQFDNIEF